MKTPKQILLDRHEGMQFKLNAIRQQALSTIAPRASWQTLPQWIHSVRWHLAGLGTVWAVILFLNIDLPSSPTMAVARVKIPAPRALVAALIENRREISEMTQQPPPAVKPSIPPRRSEIHPLLLVV